MARKLARTHFAIPKGKAVRGRKNEYLIVELATGKTVLTATGRKQAERFRRSVEQNMRAAAYKDPEAMRANGYQWSDSLGWVRA
jgi:hypothetical protein